MTGLFKSLIALTSVLAIAGCAGTGTKDKNAINALIQNADGNTAIVARSTGFAGSAPRVAVLMDDQQVASLGNNEVGSFTASGGQHILSIDFEGPEIGLRTNTLNYVNDPSKTQYFVITLESNLLGADMTISEVTASSFPSFVR